jgi:hypothetical protein
LQTKLAIAPDTLNVHVNFSGSLHRAKSLDSQDNNRRSVHKSFIYCKNIYSRTTSTPGPAGFTLTWRVLKQKVESPQLIAPSSARSRTETNVKKRLVAGFPDLPACGPNDMKKSAPRVMAGRRLAAFICPRTYTQSGVWQLAHGTFHCRNDAE